MSIKEGQPRNFKELIQHDPVVRAIHLTNEAEMIFNQGGLYYEGVLVTAPYGLATNRLKEAIPILEKAKGAELLLARTYEVYGDVAVHYRNPGEIREPSIADSEHHTIAGDHYNAALQTLGRIEDVSKTEDARNRIVQKLTSLQKPENR